MAFEMNKVIDEQPNKKYAWFYGFQCSFFHFCNHDLIQEVCFYKGVVTSLSR